MAKARISMPLKIRTLAFAGIGALALGGCSSTDGEDRFSVPAPAYPIARTGGGQDFARTDQPAPYAPPPLAGPPAPYRPEPIRPQPDQAGQDDAGALRGRQSPGPQMPVRSAPPPALETPTQVVVRPGESVFEVAERVRTPIRAIIDLNNLQPPYDVTPGSVLRIPPPVVYTVRSGDTMIGIARRFSVDPRSLANLNDIQLETALRPGQRLALPSLVKDKGPTATAASTQVSAPIAAAPLAITAASRPLAASAGFVRAPTPRPSAALPSPAPSSATLKAAAKPVSAEADADIAPGPYASQVAAAGKGKFVWPVKGDILSSYGPKGPGQRNDGLNIAANTGDPVRAAAAGQVVYAGNSVPGFGNLVVIKHEGGWTSLYGNLGKMSVKIRAEVAQGQEIGTAGTSGAVDQPQVHFELRYAASTAEKAKPLDPATLLP
jgi:murein DD-endopeptidase MepM/ murein hydrolase activator NlpD